MSRQQESLLTEYVRRGLSYQLGNIYSLKTHGSRFTGAGVPDILICAKGQFVAIEAKMLGNYPSGPQKTHMAKIIEAGGLGFWLVGSHQLSMFWWVLGSLPLKYKKGEPINSVITMKIDVPSGLHDRTVPIVDCSFVKSFIQIRSKE